MLQDLLIEGTGGCSLSEARIGVASGPRAYNIDVKQASSEIPDTPAICVIGEPASDRRVRMMQDKLGLSDRYSAVWIPARCLPDAHYEGPKPESIPQEHHPGSKAIIGSFLDSFLVFGVLPTPGLALNMQSRGHLAQDGSERVVYVDPNDIAWKSL